MCDVKNRKSHLSECKNSHCTDKVCTSVPENSGRQTPTDTYAAPKNTFECVVSTNPPALQESPPKKSCPARCQTTGIRMQCKNCWSAVKREIKESAHEEYLQIYILEEIFPVGTGGSVGEFVDTTNKEIHEEVVFPTETREPVLKCSENIAPVETTTEKALPREYIVAKSIEPSQICQCITRKIPEDNDDEKKNLTASSLAGKNISGSCTTDEDVPVNIKNNNISETLRIPSERNGMMNPIESGEEDPESNSYISGGNVYVETPEPVLESSGNMAPVENNTKEGVARDDIVERSMKSQQNCHCNTFKTSTDINDNKKKLATSSVGKKNSTTDEDVPVDIKKNNISESPETPPKENDTINQIKSVQEDSKTDSNISEEKVFVETPEPVLKSSGKIDPVENNKVFLRGDIVGKSMKSHQNCHCETSKTDTDNKNILATSSLGKENSTADEDVQVDTKNYNISETPEGPSKENETINQIELKQEFPETNLNISARGPKCTQGCDCLTILNQDKNSMNTAPTTESTADNDENPGIVTAPVLLETPIQEKPPESSPVSTEKEVDDVSTGPTRITGIGESVSEKNCGCLRKDTFAVKGDVTLPNEEEIHPVVDSFNQSSEVVVAVDEYCTENVATTASPHQVNDEKISRSNSRYLEIAEKKYKCVSEKCQTETLDQKTVCCPSLTDRSILKLELDERDKPGDYLVVHGPMYVRKSLLGPSPTAQPLAPKMEGTESDTVKDFLKCKECCREGKCNVEELIYICGSDPEGIIEMYRSQIVDRTHITEKDLLTDTFQMQKTHGDVYGDKKYHFLMVDKSVSVDETMLEENRIDEVVEGGKSSEELEKIEEKATEVEPEDPDESEELEEPEEQEEPEESEEPEEPEDSGDSEEPQEPEVEKTEEEEIEVVVHPETKTVDEVETIIPVAQEQRGEPDTVIEQVSSLDETHRRNSSPELSQESESEESEPVITYQPKPPRSSIISWGTTESLKPLSKSGNDSLDRLAEEARTRRERFVKNTSRGKKKLSAFEDIVREEKKKKSPKTKHLVSTPTTAYEPKWCGLRKKRKRLPSVQTDPRKNRFEVNTNASTTSIEISDKFESSENTSEESSLNSYRRRSSPDEESVHEEHKRINKYLDNV